jgi:signal transduction histidine kinase
VTGRLAGRLAWALYGVALAIAVTAFTIALTRGGISADPDGGIDALIAVSVGLVGALIASRRRENPLGWLLLAIALISSVEALSGTLALAWAREGQLAQAGWAGWVWNWVTISLFPAGLVATVILLFPDGHPPSKRWRRVIITGWIFTIVMTIVAMIDSAAIPITSGVSVPSPTGIVTLGPDSGGPFWGVGLVILLVCVVGVVRRLRRAHGRERQQLKWFAFVITATCSVTIVLGVVSLILGESAIPEWTWQIIIAAGFGVGLPVAFFVAIFGHGLYEIDVVIRKTVIYALFAAFATAVYLGIVIGAGTWVGRDNSFLTMVAAVVVAITFQPVRQRLTRFANRLVYGRRSTPYEVLSELSSRFAGAFSIEDALPRLARVTAEAVGAERSRVWLRSGTELRPVASWPAAAAAESRVMIGDALPSFMDEAGFAVRHQGELLGAVTVAMPANETLGPAQEKLLQDVAAHAGLVLRNVSLVEDLRASRRRIVAAQDDRARAIERNIHDGAQQQLVALGVKARLAQAAAQDPAKLEEMLTQIQAGIGEAIDDLRDLARGIYPPLLADQGLVPALEAQSRKAAMPVTLQTDGAGRYEQEVETAVYFSVLEALQNVAKYAEATRVVVRLAQMNGELRFEVVDDGRGFDPSVTGYGTGLQGMADRLAVVGGELAVRSEIGRGTTIEGRISVVEGTSP